ncbi:helical backbone metal receptor [Streptomyces fuscichromogenes]|uniref:helical backbone metal receptor n=1 Tax=Streptomyces fuscichromogenes TaxID=1324013 RepID=UPI00382577F8
MTGAVQGTENPDRVAVVALRPHPIIADDQENRYLDVACRRGAGVSGPRRDADRHGEEPAVTSHAGEPRRRSAGAPPLPYRRRPPDTATDRDGGHRDHDVGRPAPLSRPSDCVGLPRHTSPCDPVTCLPAAPRSCRRPHCSVRTGSRSTLSPRICLAGWT